jgi:hypothetical protein
MCCHKTCNFTQLCSACMQLQETALLLMLCRCAHQRPSSKSLLCSTGSWVVQPRVQLPYKHNVPWHFAAYQLVGWTEMRCLDSMRMNICTRVPAVAALALGCMLTSEVAMSQCEAQLHGHSYMGTEPTSMHGGRRRTACSSRCCCCRLRSRCFADAQRSNAAAACRLFASACSCTSCLAAAALATLAAQQQTQRDLLQGRLWLCRLLLPPLCA